MGWGGEENREREKSKLLFYICMFLYLLLLHIATISNIL